MLDVKLQERQCFTPAGSAVDQRFSPGGGILVTTLPQANNCTTCSWLEIHFNRSRVRGIVRIPLNNKALRTARFQHQAAIFICHPIWSPIHPAETDFTSWLGIDRSSLGKPAVEPLGGGGGAINFSRTHPTEAAMS